MYIFYVPCQYINLSHSALPILLLSNCQVTHTISLILTVVVILPELMILQNNTTQLLNYLKYLWKLYFEILSLKLVNWINFLKNGLILLFGTWCQTNTQDIIKKIVLEMYMYNNFGALILFWIF